MLKKDRLIEIKNAHSFQDDTVLFCTLENNRLRLGNPITICVIFKGKWLAIAGVYKWDFIVWTMKYPQDPLDYSNWPQFLRILNDITINMAPFLSLYVLSCQTFPSQSVIISVLLFS